MEQEKEKKYSEYRGSTENPFLKDLTPEMKNRNKYIGRKDITFTDGNGLVSAGVQLIGQKHQVDSEEFIKIYVKSMDIVFDLKIPSREVLIYILKFCIVKDSDMIYLSHEHCMEKCNYRSKGAIYRGLTELLKKNIIHKVEGDEHRFFINPKYIFNGSRLIVINEYERKNSDLNRDHLPTHPIANPKKLNP